ncbi:FtsK/SpoIIIE domain-containing protein, partial [Nocardia gipuzkoensis]
MNIVNIIPYAVAAAGALAFATRLWSWSRIPAARGPRAVQQILDEAPAQLRAAVMCFAITGCAQQMFLELGMGS